jgi:hypothetical protein
MHLLGKLEGELEWQREQIRALKDGGRIINGETEHVSDDLGSVEIHRELMTAAARLIIAA